MNDIRTRITTWLKVLGWIGCFLAVMPMFEYRGGTVTNAATMDHLLANPHHMPFTETYRFGWSTSPLVEHRTEQILEVKPEGGHSGKRTSSFRFEILSWSMLTLVGGVALIVLARKLQPKPAHVS